MANKGEFLDAWRWVESGDIKPAVFIALPLEGGGPGAEGDGGRAGHRQGGADALTPRLLHRGAYLVERRFLLRREAQVDRRQDGRELLVTVGADHRRRYHGLGEQPGDGDRRQRRLARPRNHLQRLDDAPAGLILIASRLVNPGAFRLRAVRAVLAGEEAAGEWAVGDDSDFLAQAEAGEGVLELAAVDEAVVRLQGDVAGERLLAGDGQRLFEERRRVVGSADVPHLPDLIRSSKARSVSSMGVSRSGACDW